MKMTDEIKAMVSVIYADLQTMNLSKQQTAKILGCSTQTLDRQRQNAIGVPYSQVGSSNVKYSLIDVCKYLENNRIITVDNEVQ